MTGIARRQIAARWMSLSLPRASSAGTTITRLRVLRPPLPELAVAGLLIAALWLPPVAGGKAWPFALAAVFGLAAVRAVQARKVVLPLPLVAYLAAVTLAAIYAASLTPSYVSAYLVRPVEAIAVATLIASAAQRRRVLFLIGLFALTQVPVTAAQAIGMVIDHGRAAATAADNVTGTLGAGQAGILTLVAMAAAVLVVGAWFAGALRTSHTVALVVALLSTGVFTATRAVVPLTVGIALVMAADALLVGRGRPRDARLVALVAGACLAVPVLYGATVAIYPGAFVGVISSQRVDVLGGAAAQGIEPTPPVVPAAESPTLQPSPPIKTPAVSAPPVASSTVEPAPAPEPVREPAPEPVPVPPRPSGVELLPGRFVQVRVAFELSTQDGVATALLGRGPGAATLDPAYHRAQDVPLPQRTGGTLIGVLLTEAGWIGLSAFAGLLVWLTWTGRRIWRSSREAWDRALGVALPGISALTAAGAFFGDILDARGYSIVLWLVVGLAISAARDSGGRGATKGVVIHV